MVDDDTGNIFVLGLLAIGGYVAYKTVGTASREAEDFADIPQRAGNTVIDAAETVGGDLWSGVTETTDNVVNAGGETANDVLAIPGNLVKTGQDAATGAWDTVTGTVDDGVDAVTSWRWTGF